MIGTSIAITNVRNYQQQLLLDKYTGAAAAYSLRKLKSNYTGAAIRVRRSSDNAETNIGFTASGNLDETALTTFTGANDGFVTTWYNQTGGGNATQTTAANQPKIVSSGVVVKDGTQPTLLFDGVNDFLSFTNTATGENYLMSVWINSTNVPANREGFVQSNGNNLVLSTWTTSRYRLASYDGTTSTVSSYTTASTTVRHLISTVRTSGAIKLFEGVTQKDSQTCNAATGTAGTWKIGGIVDAYYDGKMSDCIIYNNFYSAALLNTINELG